MTSRLLMPWRRAGGAASAAAAGATAARTQGALREPSGRAVRRPSISAVTAETSLPQMRFWSRRSLTNMTSTNFRRRVSVGAAPVFNCTQGASLPPSSYRGSVRSRAGSLQILRRHNSGGVYAASLSFRPSSGSEARCASSFCFKHAAASPPFADALTPSLASACKRTAAAPSGVASFYGRRAFCSSCSSSSSRLFSASPCPLLCHSSVRNACSTAEGQIRGSLRGGNDTSKNSGATNTNNTGRNSGNINDTNSDEESRGGDEAPKSNTWLEVERTRPRVPNPWDGTYQWPAAAPDPLEIKRESFHAFMHGKQELFSRELKVFVYGWVMVAVFVGLTCLTIHVMAPDDFEWVEEERARMERAKRKKAVADPSTCELPPSAEADVVPKPS